MQDTFVNKVAASGIVTISPEAYLPTTDIVEFDLKEYLFMGLILKEKEFREQLKHLDTAEFTNKTVAVSCSTDAIIPMWAYMLVASLLQPVSLAVMFGSKEAVKEKLMLDAIANIDVNQYQDAKIVIKGCGDEPIEPSVYTALTAKLRPVARSIMYGEPCSTVPVFKKPK